MFHWNQQPAEKEVLRNRIVICWVLIFGGLVLAYLGFEHAARYTVLIGMTLRAKDPDKSLGAWLRFCLFVVWFLQPFATPNADSLSPMVSNLLIAFLLMRWAVIDFQHVRLRPKET